MLDLLFLLRQKALRFLRFELRAVLGMLLPAAHSSQSLTRHRSGNAPHHRQQFAGLFRKAQHSIAVFLVAKNDL